MEENIKKFEDLLLSINREGIQELLEFIKKSDFFTAPASTRFHSCHKGGLLEHSLNVCECLLNKLYNPVWGEYLNGVGRESLILVSLLHDICKSYVYEVEWRNQKVYSDAGSKHDEKGNYDWQSVPFYKMEKKYFLGHGANSVIFLQKFIKLNMTETHAILHHMGFSEPKEEYNDVGNAMRKYPLTLALHSADLEATYLMEEEC